MKEFTNFIKTIFINKRFFIKYSVVFTLLAIIMAYIDEEVIANVIIYSLLAYNISTLSYFLTNKKILADLSVGSLAIGMSAITTLNIITIFSNPPEYGFTLTLAILLMFALPYLFKCLLDFTHNNYA